MSEEVLLLTHKKNKEIVSLIKRLRDQMGDRKLVILTQSNSFCIDGTDLYQFKESLIHELDLPVMNNSLVPGHAHFPVFSYISNSNFKADYYWIIEYDVRFTGRWNTLFNHFQKSDADFITSHIRSYTDEPDWYWWKLNHPYKKIEQNNRLRSFNTVYRISAKAVRFLLKEVKTGWVGHNEMILSTLLHYNGFKLLDFGGTGKFSMSKNKFYISRGNQKGSLQTGTMRYRPAMSREGFRKNMLYHPVKSDGGVGLIRGYVGNLIRLIKLILRKI